MSSWWRLRRERPRGRRGTWKGLLPWSPEAPGRRPGHRSSPCQPGVLAWLVETGDPHLDSVPETLPGTTGKGQTPLRLHRCSPCARVTGLQSGREAGGGRRLEPGREAQGEPGQTRGRRLFQSPACAWLRQAARRWPRVGVSGLAFLLLQPRLAPLGLTTASPHASLMLPLNNRSSFKSHLSCRFCVWWGRGRACSLEPSSAGRAAGVRAPSLSQRLRTLC